MALSEQTTAVLNVNKSQEQKFVLVALFPLTSFVLEGMRKAVQMILGKFVHTATQPAKCWA